MIVTPLAPAAPRTPEHLLRLHGWDPEVAATAASGFSPLALHITGLDEDTTLALVREAGRLGLDLITGDGWAILGGARSRLSALARPWVVPAELAGLAVQVGLALPPDPPGALETAVGTIPLDRPVIVGILNVTPDSFSDGGRFEGVDAALARVDALLEGGAAVIDVGAESTRPGRPEPVPEPEERARLLPVLAAIVARHPGLPVSVDTVKSGVARAALEAGAAIINDVSGGRLDPALLAVVASAGAAVVLMHSRGSIQAMASYDAATYPGGVTTEVVAELRAAVAAAGSAGIAAGRIAVDPGLGFSKTPAQNLALLDELEALATLGCPVLVGPSRKRFLGELTGRDVGDRDRATAAACALAWERGARLFRVHEPAAVRDALAVARGVTSR